MLPNGQKTKKEHCIFVLQK